MNNVVLLHPCNIGSHVCKQKTIYETVKSKVDQRLHILQFYLASPKGYSIACPEVDDLLKVNQFLKDNPQVNVFVHTCLLYNLNGKTDIDAIDTILQKAKNKVAATVKVEKIRDTFERNLGKTINGLTLELDICAALSYHSTRGGGVVHIGSGVNREKAIRRIAKTCEDVLTIITHHTERIAKALGITADELSAKRMLILECCAGEGNKIGKNLQELKQIIDLIPSYLQSQVMVCIDTAHLHSAGDWDISTPQGIRNFFNEFDRVLGKRKLQLVHLNDSKVPFGAKVDRHEMIGMGTIFHDQQTFVETIKIAKEWEVPMVMELPGPSAPYIELARSLYDNLI